MQQSFYFAFSPLKGIEAWAKRDSYEDIKGKEPKNIKFMRRGREESRDLLLNPEILPNAPKCFRCLGHHLTCHVFTGKKLFSPSETR